jgi:hypothetical protein
LNPSLRCGAVRCGTRFARTFSELGLSRS